MKLGACRLPSITIITLIVLVLVLYYYHYDVVFYHCHNE